MVSNIFTTWTTTKIKPANTIKIDRNNNANYKEKIIKQQYYGNKY